RLASYISLLYQKIKGDTIDTKLFGKESRYFNKQYKSYYNQAVLNRFITVTADMPSEKSDMLKLLGGGRDIWERQNYVETIMPSLQSDWAKKIMQQEWDSVKDELAAAEARLNAITVGTVDVPIGESIGKLEGGADLFLANQASVDSLLASIRAVYPNKSILLDVWATWCGPCIHDMKNSAENIAQLRAMDVEVVYLCTTSGTEEEKWQQKVAELNLDATQIYLNDQLSKAIMKKFDLKGYPSHLLFDTKGKYIRDFHQNIMGVNFDELKELLD
ncbi:MAG: TlpA disulfide reductase family protein, partial [Bacteroidota bacterium]